MEYQPTRGLRYLFIDFNAYFASVEQHDEPALRGRPVIVTPMDSEYSGAIAASYEARPYGIRRGTSVREARALCPDLVIRPARHDRYVVVHKQLMAAIETVLPVAKIYSVDEAAFYLSRSEAEPEPAVRTAHHVKEAIADQVGPALRASIGLAQTRLLAKLAAEMHKPDGLTVLQGADLPHRLEALPLSDIPGVGPGIERRLARNGITTFRQLWALAPKQARQIWGSVQGERFWYGLHGFEVEEPEPQKSMIGHSRVLDRGYRTAEGAKLVARALLLKAASRLRLYGLSAQRVSLAARFQAGGWWEGGGTFPPSQDSYVFLRALDHIWQRLLAARAAEQAEAAFRNVTVYLHGFAPVGAAAVQQGDLFADPGIAVQEEKRARLWAAIDRLNADAEGRLARLSGGEKRAAQGETGPRHVMLASQKGLALNYLGGKIAFSRVPDETEFLL